MVSRLLLFYLFIFIRLVIQIFEKIQNVNFVFKPLKFHESGGYLSLYFHLSIIPYLLHLIY